MAIIEMEIWKPSPDKPGMVTFDKQRVAEDIFNELEAHLKADGRMPDEYFLFDTFGNWRDGALFPRDADIISSVNFGGNEGIYIDISVRYEKDVWELNQALGKAEQKRRMVTEHFATGKTLGDSLEDLDRMNLIAASVTAAFYGNEREIRERNAQKATSKAIYGELRPGDWVIATANNDYKYLLGTIKEIVKHGTPEHTTGNDYDDIHVDFTAFDYPQERIEQIEEHFSELYGEKKAFEDLSLDEVIMSPRMLIRLSHIGYDEMTRMGELRENCKAFCLCFPGGTEADDSKYAKLIARLDDNLWDYHEQLEGLTARELINKADRIAATSDVHSYLTTYNHFDDEELDFYLLLENPLEVVTDDWYDRRSEMDDMIYTLSNIERHRDDILLDYPSYTLSEAEFEKQMKEMFPNGNRAATSSWIEYANSRESYPDGQPAYVFFYELRGELDSVKQQFGEKIALQLFNHAENDCFNPSELREAAKHLENDVDIDNLLMSVLQESNNPVEKKPGNSIGQATPKPKTLAEKLQAAGEKAKKQDTKNKNNITKKRAQRDERN